MDERFSRSARIFGTENQEKLNNAKVLVFGLGGVGGAVCEALARSGVGTLGLVDKDKVDITNINRQLIATESTIGMKKTDATEKRLVEINPAINTYIINIYAINTYAVNIPVSCSYPIPRNVFLYDAIVKHPRQIFPFALLSYTPVRRSRYYRKTFLP